ncbi:MAG: hypothetical protein SPL05_01955 [Eubacteriales bacterium]|nr:hypothetical protein [Eubacteriales bacterium]
MIQVIAGKRGAGKTKKILEAANQAAQNPTNVVVFVDYDNKHMHELKREVRLVDASEFKVENDRMLLGFLAGMITQNFDINLICIDGFKRIIKVDLQSTEWFFTQLEALSETHNVKFLITVSEDVENLPAYITKFIA